MAAQRFRIQLSRAFLWRHVIALSFINVVFTLTTAVFILLWARMEGLGPGLQTFTKYVLVQGHLATENVLAVWYSSMLLLLVALATACAWAVDRRKGVGALRHGWLVFAAAFALLSLDEIGSLHERTGMLTTAGHKAGGWIYVLGLPILAVGGFMLGFAWFHLRRLRMTFWLMAAGVGLFLLNPLLEKVEMAMIHGAGAIQGTWQRHLHDVLLVLEEGGAELFGTLCFLVAVLLYLRQVEGDAPVMTIDSGAAIAVWRTGAVLFVIGALILGWIVARLPEGDTGIPQHWFPAAACLILALAALTREHDSGEHRASMALAAICLALSGFFGAGLHGYTTWHAFDWMRQVLVAGLSLAFALALWETCRRCGGALTILTAALMAAAVSVSGSHTVFAAITAVGLAGESLTRARAASLRQPDVLSATA